MGHVKRYLPGTPSWVDLISHDAEGAKDFYAGLFGWEADDVPAGPDEGSVYTMMRKEGRAAAGLFQMPPEMAENVPSHWQTYITVDDIAAASARAVELGGKLIDGPFDVMDSGRLAALEDPTGAFFAMWQPKNHIGCEVVNEPNALTWNEVATRDVEAARAFYEALFGWKGSVDDNGYVSFVNQVGDESVLAAGMMAMPDQVPPEVPAHWIPYFWVNDVEAARNLAIDLGSPEASEIMAAGPGRFCILHDPQGAGFYMFENPSGETGPSSDKLP